MSEIIERKDRRIEDTWQLEDIFANQQAWEDTARAAEEKLASFGQYTGKLGDADTLHGDRVCQLIVLELEGGDPQELQKGDEDDALLGLGETAPGLAETAAQVGKGGTALLFLLAEPGQEGRGLMSVHGAYKLEMTRALLRTKSSHN